MSRKVPTVDYLIGNGYIPFDKSWTIRMGALDLYHTYIGKKNGANPNYVEDSLGFLEENWGHLSDDLKALHNTLEGWEIGHPLKVGESGTVYRFFKYLSWLIGEEREFELDGTLRHRQICDDAGIVDMPLEELLQLDNKTSQWASIAVITGKEGDVENPPFKLRLTYEAVEHWKQQRAKGERWVPRYDMTIAKQAVAYLQLMHTGKMDFVPEHAEDYCFARAFGLTTPEEGERKWPNLKGHETNRLVEMEKALEAVSNGDKVHLMQKPVLESMDHRVVQAIVMRQTSRRKYLPPIKYPSCVKKSWPHFWQFIVDFMPLGLPKTEPAN